MGKKPRFKRVYVEITNRCNLRCTFCPGTRRRPETMTPEAFARIAQSLAGYTSYLYLHVMGEPLLHPRLEELMDTAHGLGFRLCLTTNGMLLGERGEVLAVHPGLHRVSISLHSAEGSGMERLEGYLEGVWDFARRASAAGAVCSLRLWNEGGAQARDGEILSFLEGKLGVPLSSLPRPREGSRRLGERLYLERARKFDWPDLTAPERPTRFCLGLREQLGVLSDGTVVPCCLDHEGDIPLGNLLRESLEEILASPRAGRIYDGFSRGEPEEALCCRCGYALRFGERGPV